MKKVIDRLGQKSGRLTVLAFQRLPNGRAAWLCKCECGGRIVTSGQNIKTEFVRSCGCLAKETSRRQALKMGLANRTHGLCKAPIYRVWNAMIERCGNPNMENFPNYGGRGIKVCEAWLKFENFFADMGHQPKGMTLDRRDNDGNYYKENCRWITGKQQARNRRTNVFLNYKGQTKTIVEWSEIIGKSQHLIAERIKRGWTVEATLETPVRRK